MPYRIIRLKGTNKVKVINSKTGKVHAKSTTLEKAKKQIALMMGVDNGMKVRSK